MTDFVVTLRQLFLSLQTMDQAAYDALQEADWDALQDMQEVCQKVADRVWALESRSFTASIPVVPPVAAEMTQEVTMPGPSALQALSKN